MDQIPSLDQTVAQLKIYYGNFTRQTTAAFTRLTVKDAIKIIIVVGAYALLIRPFLVKLGMRIQAKQHADANKEADGKARLNGNHLRGKIAIPGVDSDTESDSEGEKGDVKTGEWGRKARLRQRRHVRKSMLKSEKRGFDEGSDDEIKHLLHD